MVDDECKVRIDEAASCGRLMQREEATARRRGHWRAEARASYRRRRRPKEVAHEELRERNRIFFIRDGKPNLVEAGGVGRIAISARGG